MIDKDEMEKNVRPDNRCNPVKNGSNAINNPAGKGASCPFRVAMKTIKNATRQPY
jgi:hypothetical protein